MKFTEKTIRQAFTTNPDNDYELILLDEELQKTPEGRAFGKVMAELPLWGRFNDPYFLHECACGYFARSTDESVFMAIHLSFLALENGLAGIKRETAVKRIGIIGGHPLFSELVESWNRYLGIGGETEQAPQDYSRDTIVN